MTKSILIFYLTSFLKISMTRPVLVPELKVFILKYMKLQQDYTIKVDIKDLTIDLNYQYGDSTGIIVFQHQQYKTQRNQSIIKAIKDKNTNFNFIRNSIVFASNCDMSWDPALQCFYIETHYSRQDLPIFLTIIILYILDLINIQSLHDGIANVDA